MASAALDLATLGVLLLGASVSSPSLERAIVLAPEHATTLQRQCSRPGLPQFEGTWSPSSAVVNEMESRFRRLGRLRAELCCAQGARIDTVVDYYRQYVGVVVEGRKYVYINAYRAGAEATLEREPVVVCDGGTDFWGVLYDPAKGRFVDLAFNGSS